MNSFETASFDALNSDELVAGAFRKVKQRIDLRLQKAGAFKNPNQLPTDKALKAAYEGADDKKVSAVLDATTKYWQEQAFNMGYQKALRTLKTSDFN